MPKHTILIVDDDPDIRRALRTIFEKEGYDTLAASSGEEGAAMRVLTTAPRAIASLPPAARPERTGRDRGVGPDDDPKRFYTAREVRGSNLCERREPPDRPPPGVPPLLRF